MWQTWDTSTFIPIQFPREKKKELIKKLFSWVQCGTFANCLYFFFLYGLTALSSISKKISYDLYLYLSCHLFTTIILPGWKRNYGSFSFILNSCTGSFFSIHLHGSHPWTCDLCRTRPLTPLNTWSSGSRIARLQAAAELPSQSAAQMWNPIEVGTRCRRRWAPAKARPGIHRTLPSEACGYNRTQMPAFKICLFFSCSF